MNGKNRCRILKEIRKRIADENGIEYAVSECKYKGDCLGTCPKCEAEVQYLERELAHKRSLGRRVTLAGIAAGITLTATGCTEDIKSMLGLGNQGDVLQGDIAVSYDESSETETMGEERPESSRVSDIVDGEMVEVVGEMPDYSDACSIEIGETEGLLELEPPEISDPYGDIMGDYEVFDTDIKEIAAMNNLPALEELKAWSRMHIDFGWQDYIDYRRYDMSSFIIEGVAIIEVFFDENGAVTDVKVWPAEEEIMGDMPLVEEDYE